jgi:hypothetical protein
MKILKNHITKIKPLKNHYMAVNAKGEVIELNKFIVSNSTEFEDAVSIFQSFKPVKIDLSLKDQFHKFISKHFMLMGIEKWSATIYPLKKSYKFLRKS